MFTLIIRSEITCIIEIRGKIAVSGKHATRDQIAHRNRLKYIPSPYAHTQTHIILKMQALSCRQPLVCFTFLHAFLNKMKNVSK